jgi:dTDP-4-dehydrorhamnose reductase
MRTVAVIAANGQMGSALVAALERRPDWQVRPLTRAAGQIDVTDAVSIRRALDPPPDVVINPAFWPGEEPEPALRVNALGPRLLAERCAQIGARLVHLSTDYVFGGDATAPYCETDPTDGRSVYGISKAAGEQLVRTALPAHLIVRLSGLYGRGGSRAKGGTHFVSVMLGKARRGEPLRVVADQVFSPTYAPDAATTIVALLDAGLSGTFHVTNAGQCSWYELTAKIMELARLEADLQPMALADLPPTPPRPRYSVLGHDALHAAGLTSPRPWPDALREYLSSEES